MPLSSFASFNKQLRSAVRFMHKRHQERKMRTMLSMLAVFKGFMNIRPLVSLEGIGILFVWAHSTCQARLNEVNRRDLTIKVVQTGPTIDSKRDTRRLPNAVCPLESLLRQNRLHIEELDFTGHVQDDEDWHQCSTGAAVPMCKLSRCGGLDEAVAHHRQQSLAAKYMAMSRLCV